MSNKDFIIGKLRENDFSKLFSNVTPSTQDEDVYEHWDLSINAKIDVKSIKKQSRHDLVYNENFHWVELKNVKGSLSWLYGNADFFAFEVEDYWIIVEKKALQTLVSSKCISKKLQKTKNPYTLYQRPNRKDIIMKVKTLDLVYISTQIVKK